MMLYGVEHTYDTIVPYNKSDGTVIDQADTAYWKCSSFGEIIDDAPDGNIMQYTGLKDKNGRKIFEGDIVTRPTLQSSVFEVFWYADGASFNRRTKDGSNFGFLNTPDSFEVIGNIHETPELLK